MTDDGTKHVSFAEAVLHRPTMYTLGGSYEEVIAFLQGYFSGMAQHRHEIPSPARRWFAFEDWLRQELQVPPPSQRSEELFGVFRAELNPGQDAIEELLKWLSRRNRNSYWRRPD